VEEMLDILIDSTSTDAGDDDMTMLALRWRGHG